MFEFFNGREYEEDEFEGKIVGFNENTNKLIIKGEDDNGKTKTIEINVFDSGINQNIDYYVKWEEKIYNKLKKDGHVCIEILSIESGDNYDIEICRHESILDTGDGEKVLLVNYVTIFCGEMRGKALTFTKETIDKYMNEKDKFIEWVDRQIEDVPQFNNTEYWNTFDAIVISEAFNTDKEYKLLWHMFEDNVSSLAK